MLMNKFTIIATLSVMSCCHAQASHQGYMSDSPFTPINGPFRDSNLLTTVGTFNSQTQFGKTDQSKHTFTTPLVKERKAKENKNPQVAELEMQITELQKQVANLKTFQRKEKAEHNAEKSHLHTTISLLTDANFSLKARVAKLEYELRQKSTGSDAPGPVLNSRKSNSDNNL